MKVNDKTFSEEVVTAVRSLSLRRSNIARALNLRDFLVQRTCKDFTVDCKEQQ